MEETEKKFQELGHILKPHHAIMDKASEAVLTQEISKYPIFVLSEKAIQIGIPILNPESLNGKWFLYISTLEEFATKNLISPDKVNNFRSIYKSPTENFCVFQISDSGATFVFFPHE